MIYLSGLMQFYNPNILYALFALLIPIIVHLFQLRKFEKTAFTNVKFLKELSLETRKSSRLKKWLVLCCRLLIFICIVFAFSEPYIATQKTAKHATETVIYIDNSFSNKMKGANGELLKVTIQNLIEHYPTHEKVTVLTNTNTYKNKSLETLKQQLIATNYASTQLSYKTVALKANKLFSKNKNTYKQFICISDFQKNTALDTSYFNKSYQTTLVQTLPVSKSNISIDTAYFSNLNTRNCTLNVVVKQQHSTLKTVPIAIYNNDSLISKTSVTLKSYTNPIAINLTQNSNLNLKIQVTDANNTTDNTLYISKPKPKKQNILAIGSKENNLFLTKIFTPDEFHFSQNTLNNIDYGALDQQHLIILNELENLPHTLIQNITTFATNGGTVVCIPAQNSNLNNYNALTPVFVTKNTTESRVTKIHYNHPIYSGVFEKQINTFQYPTVKEHYKLKHYKSALLSLENNNPLLVNKDAYYIFSAALNTNNTNFKQAPLVVPTLYNIAKSSLKVTKNYYHIGKENTIDIPISLANDQVLSLANNTENFIPLQQIKKTAVSIKTTTIPSKAGFYNVKNQKQNTPYTLAYNYDTSESLMSYYTINNYEGKHINVSNSLTNTINQINSSNDVATLWKWFVIFAILFLLIELLILKYFK